MLAEFSIVPTDELHMSRDVARVVEVLEGSGVDYRLGPMGTSLEGDWDSVMTAIKACHQAVTNGHGRVITTITIDDRMDSTHRLDEMVWSVEQALGHAAKHQ